MIEFIIDEEYENIRIDRFLRKNLNISLSEVYKLLRKAKIKVNNKKVAQDYRIQLNDIIAIYLPNSCIQTKEINFVDLTLDRKNSLEKMIVYEDENLFIVNKPFGEIVHRGSGHDISLLEEYRAYFQNINVNFVNRIDKLTSGLVIATKNIRTAREIATEIQNGNIIKKYYILVHGDITEEEFTITNFLKKEDEKVVASDVELEGYKIAITYYKKIENIKNKYSLLEATLETGRTHQLRVQLSNKGHSIVGDTKYGINDNEEKMYLFSYYLKINIYNIEINLEIPKFFMDK